MSSLNRDSRPKDLALQLARATGLAILLTSLGGQALAQEFPPLPVELHLVQAFALDETFEHAWEADRMDVRAGYLLVVEVDAELVRPRQDFSPLLFVGDRVAEPINVGTGSNRIVAIVPAEPGPNGGPVLDLAVTPIFYAHPQALPETLTTGAIQAQVAAATRRGIVPPSPSRVETAVAVGGPVVRLEDRYALELRAAELVERYSPEESELVRGLRAPRVGDALRPGSSDPKAGGATKVTREAPSSLGALPAGEGSLGGVRPMELAGNPLGSYPFFEFVRAFNQAAGVSVGVDTSLHPDLVGETGDLYVVAAKSRAEWGLDPSLTDLTLTVETVSLVTGSIQANTFTADNGTLSGDAGLGLGVGYDVVLDLDQDAALSSGDLIDGYGDEAGLFVVHDLTQPGPLTVTEILYSGGTWLGQDTYYPADIASMGQLPLIVVSHGNGHNYQWYDHIGNHMASYGYIVMSHQNNTGPGIQSASTTTLTNTDYFLGNLNTIAGGAMAGHVDTERITWVGHSRGGEGIVRAYDRIFDGDFVPANYDLADLKLLSSIAPTAFLDPDESHPHAVDYHLWVGGADNDVWNCPLTPQALSFRLLDRAEQFRQSVSFHGVGHGDFHDGGGSSVAQGPCLVGRSDTHILMRGYLLPLVAHYIQGNLPAQDFLWRQWERFRPIGAPVNGCIVVDLYYRPGEEYGKFVIDDFQTEPSTTVSSSGGTVTATVTELHEGIMDDTNSNFTHVGVATDPMNGMTMATSVDESRSVVFTYDQVGSRRLEFEVVEGSRDFRSWGYLSLRVAQQTRHPNTTTDLGDTTFTVVLVDGSGNESAIQIGVYGGGVEEPYQRTGCGTGTGWNNEYESIRIRLADFERDGSGLDLSDIETVSLRFGSGEGTPVGRLGLDQVEVHGATPLLFADGFESGDTSAWSSTVP